MSMPVCTKPANGFHHPVTFWDGWKWRAAYARFNPAVSGVELIRLDRRGDYGCRIENHSHKNVRFGEST